MSILSFFFPRTKVKTSSPYNRDIRIMEMNGKNFLLVNGIEESGPYMESIFTQAFSHLGIPEKRTVHKILFLGLGGGTTVKLLKHLYPTALCTCVDIDEAMISIAKEHFQLSKLPDITYICMDARKFLLKKPYKSFDLVIVDLYIGNDMDSWVLTNQFVDAVSWHLEPKGLVLLNCPGKETSKEMEDRLLASFSQKLEHVFADKIQRNIFFSGEAKIQVKNR